jgi:type II secretory pathway pseudopilin PulG
MDNLMVLLITIGVLGVLLSVVVTVVGNWQDRQAKQRKQS